MWRTYSWQVSRKTVAKSLADGVVQLAIPGVYIMMISYDLATVNIFVFIEQRSISFQNDISLKKTMRLGVLSWEKLKNRETHGRIVSFDCLKVAHRLIWNIQSPHELRQLIVLWKVQTHNIKLDTMHAQHFLIAEREQSIFNTCRFDMGGFRSEPTDYESVHTWVIHLHIAVPRITCSFLCYALSTR